MKITKQQIIDVSIDLFVESGIKNISVTKIARKAGISRSGLYHHFKKGKEDIIDAILQIFEDCVSIRMPAPKELHSQNIDVWHIFSMLYSKLEKSEAIRYRKITRIILSEMFFNNRIKQYATNYFFIRYEKIIVDYLLALAEGKLAVPSIDIRRAARFLNSLIMVCTISDALSYPYSQEIDKNLFEMMRKDCETLISYIFILS